MSDTALKADQREIVVEEVFPHAVDTVWNALTSGALMTRWLMPPSGFAPVEGCRFTFQTSPAGEWDGVIHCEVLEVRPRERFRYSWTGGHAGNVGYGSKLETVVTWTLSEDPAGTRLRLVHSGFELPRNEVALKNMGDGWRKVVPRLRVAVDEGADAVQAGATDGGRA